jgi:hypothetical protein
MQHDLASPEKKCWCPLTFWYPTVFIHVYKQTLMTLFINVLAPVLTSAVIVVYLLLFARDKFKKLNKAS